MAIARRATSPRLPSITARVMRAKLSTNPDSKCTVAPKSSSTSPPCGHSLSFLT